MYSCMNVRVGHYPIGSPAWRSELMKMYDTMGFKPAHETGQRPRKNTKKSNYTALDQERISRNGCKRKQGPRRSKLKLAPRVFRAIDLLETCPPEFLFFITVVSAFARSVDEAKKLVEVEGLKLNRYMRRRFAHAKWLLFCEIDGVLAKNVAADILPNPRWKEGLADNEMLFKVHYHGIGYIPGKTSDEVEAAFKKTESGKISKMYRGNKQVRVLPVRIVDDSGKKKPDVQGVAGYATKGHFRPPVKPRMLEGLPEWIDLTQFIANDPKHTLIGGFNEDTFDYCFKCQSYVPMDHICMINQPVVIQTGVVTDGQTPATNPHDFICEELNHDFICEGLCPEKLRISKDTLNSDRPTLRINLKKWLQKKSKGIAGLLVRKLLTLWNNLGPIRGP